MRNPVESTRFAPPVLTGSPSNADPSIDFPSRTKLLISIRNTAEAALVRAAGVDWIDLKEPAAGALGRASLSEARSVAEFLREYALRSAALGELSELDDAVACEFASLFPFLKVGLAGAGLHVPQHGGEEPNWKVQFEALSQKLRSKGADLIPVAYADWTICDAPSVQEVLQVARKLGAGYMLIDTFIKDGRRLLDWLGVDELRQVIDQGREFGCGVVLAGSLAEEDVEILQSLQAEALAVRGAVCESDRSTSNSAEIPRARPIDSRKVIRWVTRLSVAKPDPRKH